MLMIYTLINLSFYIKNIKKVIKLDWSSNWIEKNSFGKWKNFKFYWKRNYWIKLNNLIILRPIIGNGRGIEIIVRKWIAFKWVMPAGKYYSPIS